MGMKLITKNFWISDTDFRDINREEHLDSTVSILLGQHRNISLKNKITLSLEVPEKEVNFSESEFDRICDEVIQHGHTKRRELKLKYYGIKE